MTCVVFNEQSTNGDSRASPPGLEGHERLLVFTLILANVLVKVRILRMCYNMVSFEQTRIAVGSFVWCILKFVVYT